MVCIYKLKQKNYIDGSHALLEIEQLHRYLVGFVCISSYPFCYYIYIYIYIYIQWLYQRGGCIRRCLYYESGYIGDVFCNMKLVVLEGSCIWVVVVFGRLYQGGGCIGEVVVLGRWLYWGGCCIMEVFVLCRWLYQGVSYIREEVVLGRWLYNREVVVLGRWLYLGGSCFWEVGVLGSWLYLGGSCIREVVVFGCQLYQRNGCIVISVSNERYQCSTSDDVGSQVVQRSRIPKLSAAQGSEELTKNNSR